MRLSKIVQWTLFAGLVALMLTLMHREPDARTRDELIRLFRVSMGEDSAAISSVTDSTIHEWLNEGADYVAAITGPIGKDTTVPWAIDTGRGYLTIAMPVNFISVNFILVVDGTGGGAGDIKGALAKGHPDSLGRVASGYGQYVSNGQTVIIDGHQMAVLDTLKIFFFAEPLDMTVGTSECEIKDIWEPFVIDWVFHRFEQSRHFMGTAAQIRATAKQDMVDSRNARGTLRRTQ